MLLRLLVTSLALAITPLGHAAAQSCVPLGKLDVCAGVSTYGKTGVEGSVYTSDGSGVFFFADADHGPNAFAGAAVIDVGGASASARAASPEDAYILVGAAAVGSCASVYGQLPPDAGYSLECSSS